MLIGYSTAGWDLSWTEQQTSIVKDVKQGRNTPAEELSGFILSPHTHFIGTKIKLEKAFTMGSRMEKFKLRPTKRGKKITCQ